VTHDSTGLLLFYRERSGSNDQGDHASGRSIISVGDWLDKNGLSAIAHETLGVNLKPLNAVDVGLVYCPRGK